MDTVRTEDGKGRAGKCFITVCVKLFAPWRICSLNFLNYFENVAAKPLEPSDK
jgi:hypothetical protein